MDKIKIGDVVIVKSISDLHIVVSHVKDNNFQGVYFSSVAQEFKITPMLPVNFAEIVN